MPEAGDDGRELHVTADMAGNGARVGICGSVSQLPKVIRSPTERVAAVGQGAGVVCTRRDRHETESLNRDASKVTDASAAE
jgi:hypothetical protein